MGSVSLDICEARGQGDMWRLFDQSEDDRAEPHGLLIKALVVD